MLKLQMAAAAEEQRTAASRNAAAVPADSFVINLCSSTTPMALAQPDTPELKRFKFFVSRRLEDGRERFRLHMGHFESLQEAEDWLGVVRDVYPGAWAGEAPGKRLRARAAAQAHVAEPETAPAAPASAVAAALPTAAVAAPAAVHAPPPIAPAPEPQAMQPVGASAAAPSLPAAPVVVPPAPARSATPAAMVASKPAVSALAPSRKVAVAPVPAAPRVPVAPLSNVREVMAALDERDPKPATAATTAKGPPVARTSQNLTDTQVMQILEGRRNRKAEHQPVPQGIPLLRPDDTTTRRAIKEAVRDNAAVAFAVQLQWAEKPLALDKVPPLAIFSAYTLYTVEGVRQGKKWFGLRLGFFTDADAAKQVAHYVRSDFKSVAVVPVSEPERERAARKEHTTASALKPYAASAPAAQEEIPLFDDGVEPPRVSLKQNAVVVPGSASARAAAARSKRLRAHATAAEVVKAEHTLEETLEILGAGQLEIDRGRGEFINVGAEHHRAEPRKNSPFQRLLTRLTERVRKG
jgi:hypothetical protein